MLHSPPVWVDIDHQYRGWTVRLFREKGVSLCPVFTSFSLERVSSRQGKLTLISALPTGSQNQSISSMQICMHCSCYKPYQAFFYFNYFSTATLTLKPLLQNLLSFGLIFFPQWHLFRYCEMVPTFNFVALFGRWWFSFLFWHCHRRRDGRWDLRWTLDQFRIPVVVGFFLECGSRKWHGTDGREGWWQSGLWRVPDAWTAGADPPFDKRAGRRVHDARPFLDLDGNIWQLDRVCLHFKTSSWDQINLNEKMSVKSRIFRLVLPFVSE